MTGAFYSLVQRVAVGRHNDRQTDDIVMPIANS